MVTPSKRHFLSSSREVSTSHKHMLCSASRVNHAIDTQRDNEYKQQNASLTSNPVLRTELPLERHAREVYTHTNFYLFQEEFWNGLCYWMESVDGQTMKTVRDNRGAKGKLYNVRYRRDYEKLKVILESTTSLEHQLTDMGPTVGNDKRKDLETYFGCKVPDRVEIHPPTIGVTKGRKKRIKSGVEKGQEKQKHTRCCRSCNKMTTHDSRNCPLKNNRGPKAQLSVEFGSLVVNL
ncbi:hypothetical protein DM860_014993 [Cuscuta australis]|uniref:Protein FAR1-RELATED SEQUENCE n=1 Tax=Cuscuta australis TaxID=267555 RepID=A0A328DDU9_9ASTE|nr:hypothetical protein DM860_014993 [Cuscuta australis]